MVDSNDDSGGHQFTTPGVRCCMCNEMNLKENVQWIKTMQDAVCNECITSKDGILFAASFKVTPDKWLALNKELLDKGAVIPSSFQPFWDNVNYSLLLKIRDAKQTAKNIS